jgi:hypothetical protein
MVDTMRIIIKNIEVEIGNSQKAIENAKADEQTAQDNVKQKKDSARIALAELASCNLKCQKTAVRTSITTGASKDGETGKSQGSVEVKGGAFGPTGSIGQVGLTGPAPKAELSSAFSGTCWYWVAPNGSSGFAGLYSESMGYINGFDYVQGSCDILSGGASKYFSGGSAPSYGPISGGSK